MSLAHASKRHLQTIFKRKMIFFSQGACSPLFFFFVYFFFPTSSSARLHITRVPLFRVRRTFFTFATAEHRNGGDKEPAKRQS